MKNNRMFLRCNICGNIVGMIEDAGVTPVCCNEDMELLTVNTVDAAQEKHVPTAKRSDNEITVIVGESAHPMTKEHHITWIAVAQDNMTQRAALDQTGQPSATFCVSKEPLTVYSYCNLHGLWAVDA